MEDDDSVVNGGDLNALNLLYVTRDSEYEREAR